MYPIAVKMGKKENDLVLNVIHGKEIEEAQKKRDH